jgi:hypothetical protein
MKAIVFAVASIFVATALATPSLARPYYQSGLGSDFSTATQYAPRHARQGRHYAQRGRHDTRSSYGTRQHRQSNGRNHSARSHHAVGPRPARWCGWWMRTQKGGGPELNLARNWRNWGRSTGPRVGAVVVWSNHVGMITGRSASGQWIVKSGNDGGRVRERPRSVAGAVFRI